MPHIRRPRASAATLSSLALGSLIVTGGAAASIRLASNFGPHGVKNLGAGKVLALAPIRGGVVAVGSSGGRMLVERIAANGRVLGRSSAGSGVAEAVLVQRDGKIVVAGTTAPDGHASVAGDMVVERFAPNGRADRRFGHGGVVHLRGGIANAVALARNGAIVAGGSVPGPDGSPRVAIARLSSRGAPDGSLGSGGVAMIDLGPFSEANAVAVQGDGKIVFAGDAGQQVVNAVVGRVNSNGARDGGFGTGGVHFYFHPRGGAASSFAAVALVSGGRILAAGGDEENSGQHALFTRLNSHGQPDGGFGSGGVFVTPAAANTTAPGMLGVRAMAITRGGEILAAGVSQIAAAQYATLWAVSSHGSLDGRQVSGGVLKTLAGGALGASFQGIALSGANLFAGGELVGLDQTQTQGFVSRYALKGVR